LNSVDASHQNRSLGDEQLDDSIVDTLVSVDTLGEAVPLQNVNAREFFRSLLCGRGGKNRTVAPVVANYNTILILLISTGLSF
jgi:hypothetical protein